MVHQATMVKTIVTTDSHIARQCSEPTGYRLRNPVQALFEAQRQSHRVTFWGANEGDGWLNGWPIRGRTNYPLLLDRNNQPKPAFETVIALKK